MDLLTNPQLAHPGQLVGDAGLRAQLTPAVLARPSHDTVEREVWWQVARCLDSTGAAVAEAQDGADPSRTALLASCAMYRTSSAALALQPPHGQPVRVWPARHPDADEVPGARPRVVPVERTWFRLAGLLLGGSPADPELLAHVLTDHHAALGAWRRVLLGPVRLRSHAQPVGRSA